MTIAELITEVVNAVRNSFYADAPVQHFKRDERAIMKAIARYGYECDRRGWRFQVEFIHRESDAEIQYLPVYLEGAVDTHIRTRAEELSAAAKSPGNITQRAIKDVTAVNVVEKTPVETLALLYGDLRKSHRRAIRKPAVKATQETLL
jgi:hypothetical protein